MIQKTNQPLYFYAQFTANQQGKPVSATVDVYDNTNTKIVDNAPATALAFGLVRYTVANPTTGGAWAAIFKTADPTVDLQHIPALQLVGVAGVDNLDALVSSRLATASYIAPDNAGLAGAVAGVYAAAVAAKDSADSAKTSADQAARPGNAMALLSAERTAISDRLERAGGPLDTIAGTASKLATLLVSAGTNLWRFTTSALQNTPLGSGAVTLFVPPPLGLTSDAFPDGSLRVFVGDTFVGDTFALPLQIKDGTGKSVALSGTETVTIVTSRAGQIVTASGAATVVSSALGAVSYTLSTADTATRGRLTVVVKRTVGANVTTFGPLNVDVVDR